MTRHLSRGAALGSALALALVVAASGCTKHEALALLDLRSSGPLGASVARFRLTAPGWKTRVITGSLGPDGFRVGYYGPSDGGAVFVTAEALDGVDCVLGRGSASVPALASGAISEPTTLFIRPLPASGCTLDPVDAGGDDGGEDAGGGEDASADRGGGDMGGSDRGGSDTGGSDMGGSDMGGSDMGGSDMGGSDMGGSDTSGGGADAGTDTAPDAGTDAGADAAPDAGGADVDETDPDASTTDASTTDAGVDGGD